MSVRLSVVVICSSRLGLSGGQYAAYIMTDALTIIIWTEIQKNTDKMYNNVLPTAIVVAYGPKYNFCIVVREILYAV